MKRFLSDKVALSAAAFIIFIASLAILAPLIVTHNPSTIDPHSILTPPSRNHIFGTDLLGRDLFSRIVYGSRISILVGIVSVGISVLIGTLLGSIAGYYGGRVDAVIMRLVDVMLSFPTFFLILAVIAVLEPSIFNIMAVIGMTSWMGVARLVRAETMSLKERDFVASARVMGAGNAWIISRHLVPNAMAPVFVAATLGVGGAILVESALSFLGIGVQPPTPSWGNILIDGKATLGVGWWLTVFPGIFILLTVLSCNLLGEALHDAMDPRSKR